jgi:type II secretory pathway component HofQ
MGLVALALGASCLAAEQTAAQLFKEAQKAEQAGQTVRAYLLYAEAAAKDPTNAVYWTRAQALRPVATMAKPEIGAVLGVKPDESNARAKGMSDIDPAVVGSISEWDIVEAQRHPLPPPELKAVLGTKDFNLKGDSKTLFEEVAKAFNLLVVFDSGYQPVQNIRFEMNGASYTEALRALQDATNSFIVPVGDRLILVANDTTQKRQELESTAAVVIPIPEPFSVQEVQEIATSVRGALDIQRLMVDTQRRMILIRDRVWKVRAAQTLVHDLMQPRPQVAIEIQIITDDLSKSKTWGLDLPTQFPLISFGNLIHKLPANVTTSIPAGFARFLTFGAGASFMGLGLTDATLFAEATKGDASTLLNSEVVTSDGVATSFHVGQKYPLVTSTYAIGQTSGSYVPPPVFNFEDLGLILKLTPHVHGTDEMSLELSAEFKLLGASSVDNIPVIAERKLESKVRLRNGQWAVLAGLATKSELKTVTGIPGLMFIPFLRKNTTQEDRSDTLILLKPHLLNQPPTETLTHLDWIGTESRGRTL